MRKTLLYPCFGLVLLAVLLSASHASAAQSKWVYYGADGKLVYTYTAKGDRIPDFSYAGYEGGGVALPYVPAKRTVKPSGADDTDAIQAAIDQVSALPLVNGFRGAVELAPGTFHCAGMLSIAASGVVLRGAGDGDKGTTIEMTGRPHLALRIAGRLSQSNSGAETYITDAYVPEGTMTIHVAYAANLHAGDMLLIRKPVTQAWVDFMGMNSIFRNGKPEHWVRGPYLEVRRQIAAVNGDTITLAVPLMDDYDAHYFDGGHALVSKIAVSGQLSQVGVEDLRFVAPKRTIALGEPAFGGVSIRGAVDSWLRGVALLDTTNGMSIDAGSARITFLKCDVTQEAAVTSHAKPADFACNGSQILFDRCTGSGDSTFYIVTQAGRQGPVVALNCKFQGNGHIEPHQRWSTGLLIDNCDVPGGGIDMMNRGEMGSGHGWAIGWSVVWNSTAKVLGMNQPPGSMIWSIGNKGEQTDPAFPVFDGGQPRPPLTPATVDSPGVPVKPQSLYLAQLKERLGERAVRNIGY
ncbi:MAG: hypothetical protein ACRD3N_07145 [Terracidiphilus sp.]